MSKRTPVTQAITPKALTLDDLRCYYTLQGESMKPEIVLVATAQDYGIGEAFTGPGWYCRLSAPGYLDCTDWEGRFGTEADAIKHLVTTYSIEL